jgi:biotin carboxyl carrier protein
MKLSFAVGGGTHEVELTPEEGEPGRYRGRVGGRDVRVELLPPVGPVETMVVDGVAYRIAVARDRDRTWVQLGSQVFECEPVRSGRGSSRAGGRAEPEVKSPIAGKVMRLFVEAGATVTAGQKLLSVEAMKMENEIHASMAGKVARIPVTVGQAIQPGDLLVVIEPDK